MRSEAEQSEVILKIKERLTQRIQDESKVNSLVSEGILEFLAPFYFDLEKEIREDSAEINKIFQSWPMEKFWKCFHAVVNFSLSQQSFWCSENLFFDCFLSMSPQRRDVFVDFILQKRSREVWIFYRLILNFFQRGLQFHEITLSKLLSSYYQHQEQCVFLEKAPLCFDSVEELFLNPEMVLECLPWVRHPDEMLKNAQKTAYYQGKKSLVEKLQAKLDWLVPEEECLVPPLLAEREKVTSDQDWFMEDIVGISARYLEEAVACHTDISEIWTDLCMAFSDFYHCWYKQKYSDMLTFNLSWSLREGGVALKREVGLHLEGLDGVAWVDLHDLLKREGTGFSPALKAKILSCQLPSSGSPVLFTVEEWEVILTELGDAELGALVNRIQGTFKEERVLLGQLADFSKIAGDQEVTPEQLTQRSADAFLALCSFLQPDLDSLEKKNFKVFFIVCFIQAMVRLKGYDLIFLESAHDLLESNIDFQSVFRAKTRIQSRVSLSPASPASPELSVVAEAELLGKKITRALYDKDKKAGISDVLRILAIERLDLICGGLVLGVREGLLHENNIVTLLFCFQRLSAVRRRELWDQILLDPVLLKLFQHHCSLQALVLSRSLEPDYFWKGGEAIAASKIAYVTLYPEELLTLDLKQYSMQETASYLFAAYRIACYQNDYLSAQRIKLKLWDHYRAQNQSVVFLMLDFLKARGIFDLTPCGFMPSVEQVDDFHRSIGLARPLADFFVFRQKVTGWLRFTLANCLTLENPENWRGLLKFYLLKVKFFYLNYLLQAHSEAQGVPEDFISSLWSSSYLGAKRDFLLALSGDSNLSMSLLLDRITRQVPDLLFSTKIGTVKILLDKLMELHFHLSFLMGETSVTEFVAESVVQAIAQARGFQLTWEGEMPSRHAWKHQAVGTYRPVYFKITKIMKIGEKAALRAIASVSVSGKSPKTTLEIVRERFAAVSESVVLTPETEAFAVAIMDQNYSEVQEAFQAWTVDCLEKTLLDLFKYDLLGTQTASNSDHQEIDFLILNLSKIEKEKQIALLARLEISICSNAINFMQEIISAAFAGLLILDFSRWIKKLKEMYAGKNQKKIDTYDLIGDHALSELVFEHLSLLDSPKKVLFHLLPRAYYLDQAVLVEKIKEKLTFFKQKDEMQHFFNHALLPVCFLDVNQARYSKVAGLIAVDFSYQPAATIFIDQAWERLVKGYQYWVAESYHWSRVNAIQLKYSNYLARAYDSWHQTCLGDLASLEFFKSLRKKLDFFWKASVQGGQPLISLKKEASHLAYFLACLLGGGTLNSDFLEAAIQILIKAVFKLAGYEINFTQPLLWRALLCPTPEAFESILAEFSVIQAREEKVEKVEYQPVTPTIKKQIKNLTRRSAEDYDELHKVFSSSETEEVMRFLKQGVESGFLNAQNMRLVSLYLLRKPATPDLSASLSEWLKNFLGTPEWRANSGMREEIYRLFLGGYLNISNIAEGWRYWNPLEMTDMIQRCLLTYGLEPQQLLAIYPRSIPPVRQPQEIVELRKIFLGLFPVETYRKFLRLSCLILHYQGLNDMLSFVSLETFKLMWSLEEKSLLKLNPFVLSAEGLTPFDEDKSKFEFSYGKAKSQDEFAVFRRKVTGLVAARLWEWQSQNFPLEGSTGNFIKTLFDSVIAMRADYAYTARTEGQAFRNYYEFCLTLRTPLTDRYARYINLAVDRQAYDPMSEELQEINYHGCKLIAYQKTDKKLWWKHGATLEDKNKLFAWSETLLQELLQENWVDRAEAFLIKLSRLHYFLSFLCCYLGGSAFAAEVIVQAVARIYGYQLAWQGEMPDCHAFTCPTPECYEKVYVDITVMKPLNPLTKLPPVSVEPAHDADLPMPLSVGVFVDSHKRRLEGKAGSEQPAEAARKVAKGRADHEVHSPAIGLAM